MHGICDSSFLAPCSQNVVRLGGTGGSTEPSLLSGEELAPTTVETAEKRDFFLRRNPEDSSSGQGLRIRRRDPGGIVSRSGARGRPSARARRGFSARACP